MRGAGGWLGSAVVSGALGGEGHGEAGGGENGTQGSLVISKPSG